MSKDNSDKESEGASSAQSSEDLTSKTASRLGQDTLAALVRLGELERHEQVSSIASESHPEVNEDSFLVDHHHHFYGVFDGVGKYDGAALASATARDYFENLADAPVRDSLEGWTQHYKLLFQGANNAILDLDEGKNEEEKRASTAVIAKVHEIRGTLYASIAHYGDSRAYLLRSGELITLTIDHSGYRRANGTPKAQILQEKFDEVTDRQSLTPEDDAEFRRRHVISGYLGKTEETRPDIQHVPVMTGDVLILTSDGVHDNLTRTEMQEVAITSNPAKLAEALTRASLRRSHMVHDRRKADDMTAVVVPI